MNHENKYVPYGPEWAKEMMKFNKSQLIAFARRALQQSETHKNSFEQLFQVHAEFSDKTFGKQRSPIGPINHLKREVQELYTTPQDWEEYADCLLLLMDAFRRSGGNAMDLLEAAFKKLEKNKTRTWGEPDSDGVVEHIKSSDND